MPPETNELPLNDDRSRETLDCITLWQPWASWIAWGWKTIETRTHTYLAGLVKRRIAIHASLKTFDEKAIGAAAPYLSPDQLEYFRKHRDTLPRGAVVCTAFVNDHRRLISSDASAALIECDSVTRYGLELVAIEKLARPIVARGQQGIFQVRRALVESSL